MSYEDREGYGITRPKTVRTPDGTWNYYPKKGKAAPAQAPPDVEEGGGGGMDMGGGSEPAYNDFDPYANYGGYGNPAQESDQSQGGDTGGIMSDVDIGGFLSAFDVNSDRNSPRRKRR